MAATDTASVDGSAGSERDPGAYERWELPNVETPGAATVSELQAVQRQAYEEAFEEGRAAGHAAGYADGKAEIERSLRPVVQRWETICGALAAPLEQLDEEIEDALVELAMSVAKQLVCRELAIDPERVAAVVRQAVGALPMSAREVCVYLHPDDVSLVHDAGAGDAPPTPWRIAEDPALSRGGCRVESTRSRVDATVEGRLAEVIAQVLGGEPAGGAQSE